MDLRALSSLAAGFVFVFAVVKFAVKIWWVPIRMKRSFESQGISGPPYRLLYGNTMEVIEMMKAASSVPMELSTHSILPRVLPEIHHWTKAYGKNFCIGLVLCRGLLFLSQSLSGSCCVLSLSSMKSQSQFPSSGSCLAMGLRIPEGKNGRAKEDFSVLPSTQKR